MSGTTGTVPLQSVVSDQLITAALWNGEFSNIGDLMDASGCGGHSDTDSDAQIQTAPYPGSVLSKATSVAGELERLRYQMASMLGTDYWYKPAATNLASVGDVVVPVGAIVDYPTATAPNTSWHLADGTAVSRAAYPSLFTLIGTTFGAGNGTTTFNLPDYRDRMSIGAGSTYAAAATGGAATHTLTAAEIPAGVPVSITDPGHNHTQNSHTHSVTDPGHQHTGQSSTTLGGITTNIFTTGNTNSGISSTPSATTGVTLSSSTATNNSATTGITAQTNGSGSSHSILNPYLGMYKMIRVL